MLLDLSCYCQSYNMLNMLDTADILVSVKFCEQSGY